MTFVSVRSMVAEATRQVTKVNPTRKLLVFHKNESSYWNIQVIGQAMQRPGREGCAT